MTCRILGIVNVFVSMVVGGCAALEAKDTKISAKVIWRACAASGRSAKGRIREWVMSKLVYQSDLRCIGCALHNWLMIWCHAVALVKLGEGILGIIHISLIKKECLRHVLRTLGNFWPRWLCTSNRASYSLPSYKRLFWKSDINFKKWTTLFTTSTM